MRAGRLRQRIQVQERATGRDAHGGVAETWSTIATRWGAIRPLLGKEYFAAAQVNADVTHEVRFRYYKGLTPTHRLVHENRVFHIVSVRNVEERDAETVLMCTEVV